MKRLFIAALAALTILPGLVRGADFSTYKIVHDTGGDLPFGTYYGDYAWIFYTDSKNYKPNPTLVCWKVKFNTGEPEREGDRIRVFSDVNETVSGCCCVFKGFMYVFGSFSNGPITFYTHSLGGTDWAPYKIVPAGGQHSQYPRAAAELNDTMYLFVIDENGYISYLYTSDADHWSGPKPLMSEGAQQYTGGNVAVCNYQTKNGEHRLMIAWIGATNNNLYVTHFDGHSCSGNQVLYTDKGKYPRADAVALVDGSVRGGGDSGHLRVQLFYNEKSKYGPLKRAEYDVNTGTWYLNDEKTDYINSRDWIAALPHFRSLGGEHLRKEVWAVYIDGNSSNLWALRWDSDQLVKTEEIAEPMDDYKELWTLLGVVEGPPPHVLNGGELGKISPPSQFDYGRSETEQTTTSHEYSQAFFAKAGVKAFGVGVSVSYKQAMSDKFMEKTSFKCEEHLSIHPVPDYSYGYRIYLVPAVTRKKYDLRDWNYVSTGRYEYIFSVTDASLHPVIYDMTKVPGSPDPHDIYSYLDRTPDPSYPRKSAKSLTWNTGTSVDQRFTEEEQTSSTEKVTNTKKIEASGGKGIFKVEAGVEGSVSFESSHTSTFNEYVSVTLKCPDARAGHPEDIKGFTVRAYWLESNDSTAYWIPDSFKHQLPWCVTWEVTSIDTNQAGTESVKEAEPAAYLNLDVISSDPSPTGVMLSYSLLRTAPVSLKIYDASGRLAKILIEGIEDAGKHSTTWDGTDDRGRTLASGVYFARLDAGTEQRLAKIVLLR